MSLKKSDLLAIGAILLLVIIVFRHFFLGGLLPIPYNILVGWYFPYTLAGWADFDPIIPFKGGLFAADVFRQMIPWKELSLNIIRNGQLPLWNPYNFSGEPLLANLQTFTFYPLSILFFTLNNFHTAWSVYILSSPILGSIFLYLFLRSLKLTPAPSLLGALAFSFSGHMISWLEWGVVTHSAIWLPLMLYAINLWFSQRKTVFGPLLLIISAVSTILGGYPQESAYALILASLYFLWKLAASPRKRPILKQTFIIAVLVLIASLPQLIPSLRLYRVSALNSSVSQDLFLRTRLDFKHLLTLFSPDYYGNRITENYWAEQFTQVDYTDANLFIGTPALVFTLYLLLSPKPLKSHSKFFFFTALTGLILALDTPVTTSFVYTHIPILTTGVAAGSVFITVFSLCVLSAFGLDHWLSNRSLPPLIKTLSVYALVAISILTLPQPYSAIALKGSDQHLLIAIATIGLLILTGSTFRFRPHIAKVFSIERALILSVFALVFLEYTAYSHKILSFSPEKYAFPQHVLINKLHQIAKYDRVIGFWNSELSNNFHTHYHFFGTEGYNPLHPLTYQELTSASQIGHYPSTIARSDADVTTDNIPNRDRFIDLTSVKFVVSRVTNPDLGWEPEPLKYNPQRFKLVWQRFNFKIYQNLQALDRASIYTHYQAIPDKQARLEKLYDPLLNPHQTLILNTQPEVEISPQATGSAKITSYTPNQVLVNTNTSGGNSLLLLTDSFYDSWHATIDGQSTPIYTANHTFRSVAVPPGKHQIKFFITWP